MSARLASLFQSSRTALRLLVEGELREIARRGYRLIGTRTGVAPPTLEPIDPYKAWLSVNRWTLKARRHVISRLAEHEWADLKFTVLVSVEPEDLPGLAHTLDSLDQQVYENWEALIVTQGATAPRAERIVELIPGGRTRVVAVQAPNEALQLANGRFVLQLWPGDRLAPDALAEFALELADFPGTDLIFCDDDERHADGSRGAPRFKPDWSPKSYATLNFPRQAVLVRRTALDRHGAMSLFAADPLHEIVGSGESGELRVRHLPLVLHHRSAHARDWHRYRDAPRSIRSQPPTQPESCAYQEWCRDRATAGRSRHGAAGPGDDVHAEPQSRGRAVLAIRAHARLARSRGDRPGGGLLPRRPVA